MDNARERRVWSFVSDSIRDLRRLTRGPTTSLHIVKPSWLSRGGLGCSEPRYVKSYRRKQIICRWGSRLLSPVMCVYIYVYLAVQLNYIAYRFRIANKWRWVQVVLIDLKAVRRWKWYIKGWATEFIHFPRQVWNWFRDTCRCCCCFSCNENNWEKICIEVWLLKYNWWNRSKYERITSVLIFA